MSNRGYDKKGQETMTDKTLIQLKKSILLLFILAAAVTMMAGCGKSRSKDSGKDGKSASEESSTESAGDTGEIDDIMMEHLIEKAMNNMTLEQKIGQMFIVCTDSLDFDAETQLTGPAEETLKKYQPGGVILFSFNLKDRQQTARFIDDMQARSKIPLFIAVDEEGGNVARVAGTEGMNTTVFPPMAEVGRRGDLKEARKVGTTIGQDLSQLGFNLDFAPVADVMTNESNTEIGDRSFGSDPKLVSDMVSEVVQGLQSQGVSATLKHFPGQGDSGEDTHRGYVNLDTSIDRLRDVEFVPFEGGIRAGADLVMVSHVAVSNITQNEVPASLSSLMVKDILREELQFDNIIITDAMNMKVITKFYDPAQAAVMAVQAGNDMILMPDDFQEAYSGILEAVEEGDLSERAINDAAERIITVKIRRGIIPLDAEILQ